MGYWEQIGVENRAHMNWRTQGGWWRRVDWLGLLAIPAGIAVLAIMAAPLWWPFL